jgi:hypothetical protein
MIRLLRGSPGLGHGSRGLLSRARPLLTRLSTRPSIPPVINTAETASKIARWSLRMAHDNTFLSYHRNAMIATVAGAAMVQYRKGEGRPPLGAACLFAIGGFCALCPSNSPALRRPSAACTHACPSDTDLLTPLNHPPLSSRHVHWLRAVRLPGLAALLHNAAAPFDARLLGDARGVAADALVHRAGLPA